MSAIDPKRTDAAQQKPRHRAGFVYPDIYANFARSDIVHTAFPRVYYDHLKANLPKDRDAKPRVLASSVTPPAASRRNPRLPSCKDGQSEQSVTGEGEKLVDEVG